VCDVLRACILIGEYELPGCVGVRTHTHLWVHACMHVCVCMHACMFCVCMHSCMKNRMYVSNIVCVFREFMCMVSECLWVRGDKIWDL
jgi:hypothetical protein